MADKDVLRDFNITDGQLWEYTGQSTDVVIPDGVTEIAEYAFRNKSFIRSVKLPGGLSVIGRRSFENCTGLRSISMPDSVKSVDEYAFTNCTNLGEVKLSSGLNVIEAGVFAGCSALKEIRIPQSVHTIEAGAFVDCPALEMVYISSKTYTIKHQMGQHPFNGSDKIVIYTPSGSAAERFAKEHGFQYVNIQHAPDVSFRFSSPAGSVDLGEMTEDLPVIKSQPVSPPRPEPKPEPKPETKGVSSPEPKPAPKQKPVPVPEPAKPKPAATPKPAQDKPSPADERRKARAEDKKRKLEEKKQQAEEKKRRAEEKERRKELEKAEAAESKSSKSRTLEPGRKFMVMLLIAFLVGGAIMFVATRTVLKPEQNNAEYTLEEFISVSPDAKLQIQQSVEDTSVSVYVSNNELIYKIDLSDSEGMTEEAAKNSEVIASLEESLDSQDGKFIELCRSLEKDTGIKGISVRVLYTYGDEKLISRTYTSNGKY